MPEKSFSEKVDEIFECEKDFKTLFKSNAISFLTQMKERSDKGDNLEKTTPAQKKFINSLYEQFKGAHVYVDQFFELLEKDKEFKKKYEHALIYYTFLADSHNSIYYNADSYFESHANFLETGEKYMIGESTVNRMLENKYFKKIWAGYTKEPDFKKGGLAMFRKNGQVLSFDGFAVGKRSSYRRSSYGNPIAARGKRNELVEKFPNIKKIGSKLNEALVADPHKMRQTLMKGPLFILNHDLITPVNSCNGNKIYHVLPLSEPTPRPVAIEERHLKTYRG